MLDFVKIQPHLTATILFSLILRANAFSYKDAKNWGEKYSDCNGKNQSPVILNPPSPGYPIIKQAMKFTNFNKLPTNVTMKNTGHTVELKAHWSGKPPTLSGGPFHKHYVFSKFTFHWAQKEYTAGEDDTDSQNPDILHNITSMEAHIFFYRKDLKSFEKAQSQKGGLAAFQLCFQMCLGTPEHLFDNLLESLHKVQYPNSAAEIPPSRLTSIIFDRVYAFDFYEGSLDYPPCSESVTWFVGGITYDISDKLVNEFRKIKLDGDDKSNLRPPQALNDRQPQNTNSFNGKDE